MPNFQLAADFKQGTPGNRCYLCQCNQREDRTGARERVVDPNVHIDWEGPLQFCETCVVEMGRLVGMVTEAQIVEAENIAADAVAALDQALAEVADLRNAVESLTRAGWQPSTSGSGRSLVDRVDALVASADATAARIDEFGVVRPPLEVTFECGIDGCDRTFGSEHGLNIHQGRSHREQTTTH